MGSGSSYHREKQAKARMICSCVLNSSIVSSSPASLQPYEALHSGTNSAMPSTNSRKVHHCWQFRKATGSNGVPGFCEKHMSWCRVHTGWLLLQRPEVSSVRTSLRIAERVKAVAAAAQRIKDAEQAKRDEHAFWGIGGVKEQRKRE
jgi:hypothetical protein